MIPGIAHSRWLACGMIAAGSSGVVLVLAAIDKPVRGPLVLLFLAAAPAAVVGGLLRGLDTVGRIVVGGAAATAINAVVAETMLASGTWSPPAGLVAVAAICAGGGLFLLPPAWAVVASRRRAGRRRIKRSA
jgi:hypothetical protein